MILRTLFLYAIACAATTPVAAQTVSFSIHNPNKEAMEKAPVAVKLADLNLQGEYDIKASVAGMDVPVQIDDMDGDGMADELFMLATLKAGETQKVSLTTGLKSKKRLIPRTYAEIAVMKQTQEGTQYVNVSDFTVAGSEQAYKVLCNEGLAFETDMVGYLVRFDKSYSVSLLGKSRQTLELRATHMQPDSVQQGLNYGSIVLDGYENIGLGSLRAWDGTAPDYLTMASKRRLRVVTTGPLRTVVEVHTYGWEPKNSETSANVVQRFTVYAGHRDCRVDVSVSNTAPDFALCTGMKSLIGGLLFSDKKGLYGCWGPIDEGQGKLGMGMLIPDVQLYKETMLLKGEDRVVPLNMQQGSASYFITFCSSREKKSFASSQEWFSHLKQWKQGLTLQPIEIK